MSSSSSYYTSESSFIDLSDEDDDSVDTVTHLRPRLQSNRNHSRPTRQSNTDGADFGQPTLSNPFSNHYPTWQEPPKTVQRQHVPPDYPQNGLPVQNPAHQPRGNFWEQLDHGAQQQGEKSLVSTRRPWAPNIGQPPNPSPRRLEGPAANAAGPAVTTGPDHGVKADPQPPWPTYLPYSGPVATEESGVRTPSPDKGPPEEPLGKGETAGATTTRVDLVHDPSRANKDMSIRIELDAEEDWEDDLEEFCRLKRLGLIKEAKEKFWSALGHVNTMPYIRVQYAEMLQLSGDFKGFQDLDFLPEFPPIPTEETPDDRSRGKLVANHALLDLLSQRPIANYLTSAWGVVRHTLKALAAESTVGSTEIQLIVLCLRVLDYLKTCTHETAVGPAIIYANRLFNWRQLYHDLVGESCVWDFKDLFFASVSTFGWEKALVQFFETTYFPRALDSIIQDWTRPFYDEASVMGLLDLFTSLILKDHDSSMKTRNTLLLHHARTMAESAERNDPELMKTKPFVQWLLAKSVLELGSVPERPDGVRMEHFSGLRLNQGGGVHLPIYVPSRHTRKPDWDMFFSRSTPAQRRVVEVAVRAADQLGDYNLQAEALKLLILQSQDPKQWMAALAQLQLETQGDKEGYFATCLSRYLVVTDPAEEATLLKDLEKPGGPGNALYFEQCENASLTWAWSMIRVLLTTAHSDDSSVATGATEPSPFLTQGFSLDGSKLPPYIAEFARVELGVFVSEFMGPLSLADLEPTGAGEVKEDRKPPEEALRDRFTRAITNPATDPPNMAPYEPWGWTVDPANWPNSRPPPRAPAPPPAPPPKDPWNYYNYRQPNPLAQGVTPNLEVKGWPKTWYEDAKRYAPSVPQRPVDDSDSDTPERFRIVHTVRTQRLSDSDSDDSRQHIRKTRISERKHAPEETAYMARERLREEGGERRVYGERDMYRERERYIERARDRAGVRDRERARDRERERDEESERFDDSEEMDSRLGNNKRKLSNIRLERWQMEGEKQEGTHGRTVVYDNPKDAKQEWNRGNTTPEFVPHKAASTTKTKNELEDYQEKVTISTKLDNRGGGHSGGGSKHSEKGLHITMEDGVTKLYFPSSHPGGSGTTVVLNDKHPRRSNAYVAGKDGDLEASAPNQIRPPRRTLSLPVGNKSESSIKTIPIVVDSPSDAVGQQWHKYKKKQMEFNERRKSPYATEVKTEDEADRQAEREYDETEELAPPPLRPPLRPPQAAEPEPKPGPKPANIDVNDTRSPIPERDERQTAAATAVTTVQNGLPAPAITIAESKPEPATELAAEPTVELPTEPITNPEAPPSPTIASTEPTTTTAKQQAESGDPWADLWATSKKAKRLQALLEAGPEPEPEPATAGDDIWSFSPQPRRRKKRLNEFLSSTTTQTPEPETMPRTADSNADEQPAQNTSNETLEAPKPAPVSAPPSPPAPAPVPAPQPQPTANTGQVAYANTRQQASLLAGWGTTTHASGWGSTWDWGRPAEDVDMELAFAGESTRSEGEGKGGDEKGGGKKEEEVEGLVDIQAAGEGAREVELRAVREEEEEEEEKEKEEKEVGEKGGALIELLEQIRKGDEMKRETKTGGEKMKEVMDILEDEDIVEETMGGGEEIGETEDSARGIVEEQTEPLGTLIRAPDAGMLQLVEGAGGGKGKETDKNKAEGGSTGGKATGVRGAGWKRGFEDGPGRYGVPLPPAPVPPVPIQVDRVWEEAPAHSDFDGLPFYSKTSAGRRKGE